MASEAEQRVKAKYPDALEWQDDMGHWYISLPHLGESQSDQEETAESAWADAASRLEVEP